MDLKVIPSILVTFAHALHQEADRILQQMYNHNRKQSAKLDSRKLQQESQDMIKCVVCSLNACFVILCAVK